MTSVLQQYAPLSTLSNAPLCVYTALLQKGELFVNNLIRYRFMTPNKCHDNVLHLWNNGEIAAMCVGFALAPDRKWRFHSWGLNTQQDIVETTAPFLLYFGCIALNQ